MRRCHQLLSGFLAKGHVPRGSRQSYLLANDKGDNEVMPGAVHRFLGIYLTAEDNPGNPQLGDRRRRLCEQSSPLMASLASKWGHYNHATCQEGRRKELRKGEGEVTQTWSPWNHGGCGQKSYKSYKDVPPAPVQVNCGKYIYKVSQTLLDACRL